MAAGLIADEILRRRKVLLWIGAGNSHTAGIPTDTDDEHGLAFRLAMIHYHNDRAQIEAQVGPRFRLARLAEIITKGRVREFILQQV